MTEDREIEMEIRRLFFAEHWKRGTIAVQLGVHGDVVERVIGPLGPRPASAEPRPSLLDPYCGFVTEGTLPLVDREREQGEAGDFQVGGLLDARSGHDRVLLGGKRGLPRRNGTRNRPA